MDPKNKPFRITMLLLGFAGMIFYNFNYHLALAAWLAPVFVLRFVRDSKTSGFLLFVLVAMVAGTIGRTGLALVDMFILHVLDGISFGLFYCLAYLIDRLLYKKQQGFYYTLLFPSAIVAIEYLVTLLIGTLGVMAHTQYFAHFLTQLVSVLGLYSISFLIAWFASVVNWVYENNFEKKAIQTGGIIYASVLIMVIMYGIIRLNVSKSGNNTVKVAAITTSNDLLTTMLNNQQNIEKFEQGLITEIPEEVFAKQEMIDETIRLTEKAAREGAKIIVWNECALIVSKEQKDTIENSLKQLAQKYGAYILPAYLEEVEKGNPKPFNNRSRLITPTGEEGWSYKKSALHPQGEVPIINPGNFEIPYLDTEYGRLGNVICYDLDIYNYIKQTGEKNIDILLVPSYDWKEFTPLHSWMASFEAIRNGFNMVRPNGKGLTAMYNYLGLPIVEKETFMVDGIVYGDVPVKSVKTVYTSIGNFFVYLCIAFLVFMLAIRFRKR